MRFFVVPLIVILLGLSACAPGVRAVPAQALPARAVPLTQTPVPGEPTSIVLVYRTLRPSETPVPPTPGPTSTPNLDPEEYFGGMVVSLDEVGQTIPLRVTQNFLLSLGEEYTWTVSVDPAWVLSQNMNITPLPGEQGVFIARQRGKAVLRATGEPACRKKQPPCERPNVLFQINIVVE